MTGADFSPVHEQLRQYTLRIEDHVRQEERQRIARDLHDSLGHALTALNVQLQTAVKLWKLDPAKAELFLAQAQQLGSTAIQEVRQSVGSLRTLVADLPLELRIESLVEDFRQVTDVAIATRIDLTAALPQDVSTTLYRLVQEALTNIRKHAAATAVQIQLTTTLDQVQLTITDNGIGFCLDDNPEGFGLQGMAERVVALSGQFHIKTQPGSGCQIQVELPLQQQDSTSEEQLASFDSIISALTAPEPLPHLTLPLEWLSRLESVLEDYIGLIAPALIQHVAAQVPSYQALVEELALHIPAIHRPEFEQRMTFLVDPSLIEPGMPALSYSSNQAIDEHSICQCEAALVDAIGPIAPLVMQQMLQASPQTLAELIEMLVAKIPNPQMAVEFQQRLSSYN